MTTHRGARRLREGRTYMSVDAENLLGTPFFSEPDAVALACGLSNLICVARDRMQVALATGHLSTAIALRYAFGAGQAVWRGGPDGADLALIDLMEGDHIAERFASVVVASGDGRFTDVTKDLVAKGCHVTVVSRPGSLSTRLRLAASAVLYLPVEVSGVEAVALPSRLAA